MKSHHSRILSILAGFVAVLGAPAPALADDSEVFLSSAFTTGEGVRPNVLLILDTSYSMTSEVENNYDPTRTYAVTCDPGYVYWQTSDSAEPPDCTTTTQKFTLAANRCRASYLGMLENGWWRGRVRQLKGDGSGWQGMVDGATDRKVECEGDRDTHGDVIASAAGSGSSSGANRPRNGAANGSRWGNSDSSNQITWSNANTPSRSFYSANYINWWVSTDAGVDKSRMDIVKEVATKLITDLQGVNVGLMRYSDNNGLVDDNLSAQGGMVTYPISELTLTTKAELIEEIEDLTPTGFTPLSETYYEAHQYLSGGAVDFGNSSKKNASTPLKSVATSRTGNSMSSNTYKSPMLYSCQKTFIVYLTDGLPTQDESASSKIMALPDFATDGYVSAANGGGGATCPASGPDGDTWSDPADGRCMVNMAGYMYNHDMRSTVLGEQNVTTYVIGFGSGIASSKTYLEQIAKAGGGRAYTQSDAAGLTAALEEILTDVVEDANTTFVSPTVAVNAFNRTRTLDSLYVSVFAPTNRMHWPGNVKKYKLVDGVIHGKGGPAVDEDLGFFEKTSEDFFNEGSDDQGDVTLGGAASRLPAWASRKVYTDLNTAELLTADANKFRTANTAITRAKLGLPAIASPPNPDPERVDVIEFALGRDVNNDVNPNGSDFTETRKAMGDPMHSRPAVAIYGGTQEAPTGLVFVTTNDGMLQALDMDSGVEQWSFMPHDMMARLASLQEDLVIADRDYGVDGDVRVFKYDVDDDGVIESGDRMYVLFGFGRGGSAYYALDVTDPALPKLLWKKTAADLPMLGKAWSTPVVTRVNVNSNLQTDPQKHVIVFGAGYDTSQDGANGDGDYAYTEDGVGNGVYMLELKTGNLLWSAGITGSSANWKHPFMNNSIPAEIALLDINGDGYSDRMYFGDMGGRIWRLDIWHGQAPASLVSGGLMATLGAGHLDSPAAVDARRFYYAPDVALVTPRGSAPYFNIAIGSGYRGHPLDTTIRDRFYSIRDYQPFNRRTNTSFNDGNWSPIEDGDLVNVTSNVNTVVDGGAAGWKLDLAEGGTTWQGEKVLGEAVTANGVIFFPTFTPTGTDPDNPCLAKTLNRTWAVYLDSARPYGLQDVEAPGYDPDEATNDPSDRYENSGMEGIAPSTSIVQNEGKTICLKGVAAHKCVDIGDVTRTFWERRQ